MNTKPLRNLGLNESEIKVYLLLLKKGLCSATEIAKETALNRSHIYDKLGVLLEKGLMSFVLKNNVKYFKATNPDKITDHLRELEKEIQTVIPELKKIQQIPKKETVVELYQGKEGMKAVFKDVLREKKDYFVFGEEGKYQKLFPIFIQQFLRDVKKNKMIEHLLSKESKRGKIMVIPTSRLKYLPDNYFSPTMTAIYGSKVAIFIWSHPLFAILIKDKDVAKSYKSYFNILWNVAKK